MRILFTRDILPEDLCRLEAMHASYDIIPFLQLKFTQDTSIIKQVQAISQKEIIAVFTSPTAVKAVQSMLPTPPASWQIICTAPGTALLIKEWLGANVILHSGINAEEIIPYFEKCVRNIPIVLFRGNKSLHAIPKALHLHGFDFEKIGVYHNELLAKVLDATYDYYLFFSPSAVDAFFINNRIPESKIAIAIGKTTAKQLASKKINNLLTASIPNVESMLQLIQDYEFKK